VYLRNTENPLHPAIVRYHPFDGDGMIHTVSFRDGQVSSEKDLSDSCTEFGTINSGFGGRPYRYNYAATNEPGWFLFNGLVRYDALTGREERYQFEPGVFCSEVGVAPRVGGTEEDDAYLVTLTVDMNRDLSECVVFRANDVGRGPIARAQLPRADREWHAQLLGARRVPARLVNGTRLDHESESARNV
jgi:carotenoid cleavage dioxygenase-like enzyme